LKHQSTYNNTKNRKWEFSEYTEKGRTVGRDRQQGN